MKHIKPEALEVRDLRVGDILLSKGEESQIIIAIAHDEETYTIRTTDLAGENPRFDTYDAPDEVNVWGTQEALF